MKEATIIILILLFCIQIIYADEDTVKKTDWNDIRKSIIDNKLSVEELTKTLEKANKDGDFENIYALNDVILKNDNYKDNAKILNELGTSAFNTQHISDAFLWLNRALEIDPLYPEANANLGVIYRTKGKYEDALKYFQTALNGMPSNSVINYDIAICYERLGKSDEAEKNYKKAIELDNKFAVAYKSLAVLLLSQKRNNEALNILRIYSGLVGGKDEDAKTLIKQLSK
jgi:tetratricopeptide (TPR) repeat protein